MSAGTEIPCGPAADGHDTPYWEGLREDELRIQRCGDCRTWLWGPRRMCPNCHGFRLGFEPVAMTGTVYSWCRTHHPYMAEYADRVPYVSVVVELPQAGGVRLLGLLDGAEAAIGVRLVGFTERPANAAWPLLRWRRTEGEPA